MFKILVLFNQQGKPKEQILTSKKQRKQVFFMLEKLLRTITDEFSVDF